MNNLAKTIKEVTGLTIGDFCANELKTDYKAFNWRVKNNRLYPDEIVYMIWRTRKSVQELFGKSWHELVIENSGGPVVQEVKDIMGKMSKVETKELERLMGLEQYREREGERHTPETPPNAEYPNTPSQASEKPPDDAPPTPTNTLASIFKNTY